ncbi:unnamed protein product [Meloidogyne enterolobii]|uniref:Uncharacterized protein n=1 Tax=Meloidogyne enterolobii TaxID=390850 RepID=A0ACB0YNR3_MELEN
MPTFFYFGNKIRNPKKFGCKFRKAFILDYNCECYKPFVWLKVCSIETNFGNDLESKPFKYDIFGSSVIKKFY